MIKLFAVEMISGVHRYYEIEPDIKDRTTEGYFCTVEELRELFEAGGSYYVELNDSSGGELNNLDFDQWLASKERT